MDNIMDEELQNEIFVNVKEEILSEDLTSNEEINYLEKNSIQNYLNDIAKYPVLTPEEEYELGLIIQNGTEKEQTIAKKRLTECNLKLVVSIAKNYYKYTTSSYTILDMIQEGNLGLIRSIDSFDVTKGYKLSTYATPWIQQYIKLGAINKSTMIRKPNNIYVKLRKIFKIQNQLMNELGRNPDNQEICDKYNKQYPDENMTITKYHKLISTIEPLSSLDSTIGEDKDTTLNDFLIDKKVNVEEDAVNNAFIEYIFDIMDRNLTIREKDILLRRIGYYGDSERLIDISKKHKITLERVRQIEDESLNKIRRKIKKNSI